jgi:hypothetical protein
MRIISCPELTVVYVEHTLTRETYCVYHLCTGYYVQRAHPQFADVSANGKTASVEDGRLETDVHSMSVDHREVLRVPSIWTVPIFTRYHVSFSAALVPQL